MIGRKLSVFTHKCLCMGIRWPQKVTNLEVRKICNHHRESVNLEEKDLDWTRTEERPE